MRRKDREVSDFNKVIEVLNNAKIMRLALADKYILPVCFGYEVIDNSFVLYFHCGKKGRKNEILERDPIVGFEIEGRLSLLPSDIACRYNIKFESIIGLGSVVQLTGDEKINGLNLIMNQIGGEKKWCYNDAILGITDVFKIEVSEFECKSNIK